MILATGVDSSRRILNSQESRFWIVGSEEARLRAGLRPPLKLHVRFSRMQLSRRHITGDVRKGNRQVGLAYIRKFESGLQYPRTMMYGFSLSELIHLQHPYSSGCPPLPSCLRLPPSPTHSGRRSLGHVTFITLQVLFGSPTTDRASLAISLPLIGPLTPVSPGDSASPPEVTRCSSVPCRPQTPWCGG